MRSLIGPRKFAAAMVVLVVTAACTKQIPNTFRLQAQEQTHSVGIEMTTEVKSSTPAPIDVLWVIDNSSSMSPSQGKLKKGLESFAKAYLKPNYDIRMAVITTDTFLADDFWSEYHHNPANKKPKPKLKKFWDRDYAKLLPGKHDGNPESKLSGEAILSTLKAKSTEDLISKFKTNVDVGTAGLYEERGFDSVLQLLKDNELPDNSQTRLFRKGSQRIIVFLSDENDQTINNSLVYTDKNPEERKLLYSGSYYIPKGSKDDPKVQAQAKEILPKHFTIDCENDGIDVAGQDEKDPVPAEMSICVRPELLISVDDFKEELDSFFANLDNTSKDKANYIVVSIVTKDPKTIAGLRLGTWNDKHEVTHEKATRYLELAEKVGGASSTEDIGTEDYSDILNNIGKQIDKHAMVKEFKKNASYDIGTNPEYSEKEKKFLITAAIVHADRSEPTYLSKDDYTISGSVLTITNPNKIEQIQPGDRLSVEFTPKTVLTNAEIESARKNKR